MRMNNKYKSIVIFCLILAGLSFSQTAPKNYICSSDSGVGDTCFVFHGKLIIGNGPPSMRILNSKTKRIYGVLNPKSAIVPDTITKMDRVENIVFADFRVCQYSKNKSGKMQMVCIDSMANITIRKSNK
jgi:hypothetical protein